MSWIEPGEDNTYFWHTYDEVGQLAWCWSLVKQETYIGSQWHDELNYNLGGHYLQVCYPIGLCSRFFSPKSSHVLVFDDLFENW
jgi:hypothetical protein